jgi:hypothetical protein
VTAGLPLENRLLNKLWQVSKILGNKEAGNPFDPVLLALNEPQLDFILEKYVSEDPKRGKFIRPGRETMTEPQRQAAWERVLSGAAKERFWGRMRIGEALRSRAASLRRAAATVRGRKE